MAVVDIYYVGGFGVMGWLTAADYDAAKPDPLADAAAEIIQHMNADHQNALIAITRAFGSLKSQEAAMTSVDRLGFHLRLRTAGGMRGTRIAFPREVASSAEARAVLVEMTQRARQEVPKASPR